MLQFRPALIPTVAMVLLVPLFISLGLWQVERAQHKDQLADLQEIRGALPPLRVDAASDRFEEIQFRHLSITGTLRTDKQIFIENRKHLGRSGFHVVTPMQIEGSNQYMLINRGWIADTKQESRPVDTIVSIPQPPALILDESIPSADQRAWPFLTLDKYQAWSGLEVVPFLLLQSPDDETGFIRQWPVQQYNGAMHIGYAIQWFAFAVIALGTWLRLTIHKPALVEGSA